MEPDRIQLLLKSVETAFEGIPRPECTKRVARAMDDEWFPDPARVRELQALDTETRWQEVSDEDLVEYCNILPWISPQGFRFYYPAFLLYALRHWNEFGNRIRDEAMEAIGNNPEALEEFSAKQKQTVHTILSELAATPGGAECNYRPTLIALRGQAG